MISTEKVEAVTNNSDNNVAPSNKTKQWNEQPHVGKYKLIKTIGKGNFAKVKLAQHVTTSKKVAVKVIDKTALNTSSLNKLFREVRIMKTLDHPNIVKLFEVIESERHVYLVMEYAPKGEVFDYLVQNGRMKEKEARQRFREIVSAIQYCHQKNIVHRDLKAENLLLGSECQIKIADFGFANQFDNKKQLDTFCGSPPYAAPELFQGRKYDGPEVDVWSLGVILYTLVSGSLPFDGHNMRELRERVLRGKYRIPFYMTTDCEMLLKKMLIVNPQKRYSLLDVMKDKWINIGYEDSPLVPFKEPTRNFEDPLKLNIMETLGFSKDEVLDSLYNAKFNNVTATYLLLDFDVNKLDPNYRSTESIGSSKNPSGNHHGSRESQKNATQGPDSNSSKAIARSGSAVEARMNTKVNGDTKSSNPPTGHDASAKTHKSSNPNQSSHGQSGALSNTSSEENQTRHKSTNKQSAASTNHQSVSNSHKLANSGSAGIPNTADQYNDGDQSRNYSPYSSPIHPQHAPGPYNNNKQLNVPNTANNTQNPSVNTPTGNTNTSWVKRNNTFTYADKNTTSEIESRPVVRTKNVMNMFCHVTPATIPLPMDTTPSQKKTSGRHESGSHQRDASLPTAPGQHHPITNHHNPSSVRCNTSNPNEIPGGPLQTNNATSGGGGDLLFPSPPPNVPEVFDNTGEIGSYESSEHQVNNGAANQNVTNNIVGQSKTSFSLVLEPCTDKQKSSQLLDGGDKQPQKPLTGNTTRSSGSGGDINGISDNHELKQSHDPLHNNEDVTKPNNTGTPFSDAKTNTNAYSSVRPSRQSHTNSLFRSFTSRISSSKLIRRLTTSSKHRNQGSDNQSVTTANATNQSDPWTPRNASVISTNSSNETPAGSQKHHRDRSTDYSSGDNHTYKGGHYTLPNPTHQASSLLSSQTDASPDGPYFPNPKHLKPRVMHLIFRKSLTCKVRPAEFIVSEILRCLQPFTLSTLTTAETPNTTSMIVGEIQLLQMKQIAPFVISCQGRLASQHSAPSNAANELIQWEIEVFRLARPGGGNTNTANSNTPTSNDMSIGGQAPSSSSSYALRIKKLNGSNTRFKAIHKILVNKLTPPLTLNKAITNNMNTNSSNSAIPPLQSTN